jgi:hypothetical protein
MRSLGLSRDWNDKLNWVNAGTKGDQMQQGKFYHHTPLVVRTDQLQKLQSVLQNMSLSLASPLETLPRDIDLTHLWPLDLSGVGDVASLLRQKVSRLIHQMNDNETIMIKDGDGIRKLKTFVGRVGGAARTGRRTAQGDYMTALLNTKIIVITQRDLWEDHYRLMEGLMSGAMVLHDAMHGKPAGIVNGSQFVEFNSEESLQSLSKYYLEHDDERLAIAKAGRFEAMSRHRSWHRMEEIIFSDVLTRCIETMNTSCPYIIHANESLAV